MKAKQLIVMLAVLVFASQLSATEVINNLQQEYSQQGAGTFSAERGKPIWEQDHNGRRCTNCHTSSLPTSIDAQPITSPTSRFAENKSLFRLSGSKDGSGKGHGGVMCEGCHGSTHAIWPSANPNANDNIAAKQIQGHAGTVTECVSCHASGSLGITLGGPHGMHPVGGTAFANGGHEHLAEKNPDSCRACHGKHGEGSVLSRVSKDRSFNVEDAGRINLRKGQQVSCTLCHSNKL